MIRHHFAAATAVAAASLVIACTATTTQTGYTQEDGGSSTLPSSSSGGKSSSSGGKSSSSGGSSSGGSSSGGSSSGGSSSGGSSSGSISIKDGGKDGSLFSVDAGPDADPNECPVNVGLTAADLDAEIGWKSAVKTPGACTAADITTLTNNFSSPTITTYFDLGNGLSNTCKTCVISNDTDANWQPIVGIASNGGATGFINFGACFGNVEGSACGKALQYEQFCYNVACNDCTTTTAERNTCVSAAGTGAGMCKGFGDSTTINCPNAATTNTSCGNVIDAVKYLCQ